MDSKGEIAQLQTLINTEKAPLTYMKSYGEIKDYMLDKHGAKGWIGGLAQQISGSATRSGKEYLAARRSIERYEKGQFSTMKKYDREIPRVGKELPATGRQIPGGSITITFTGHQEIEKKRGGGTRDRTFTATFTGSEALAFANNPSYRAVLKKTMQKNGTMGYPDDVIDLMEDGEYELVITAVA